MLLPHPSQARRTNNGKLIYFGQCTPPPDRWWGDRDKAKRNLGKWHPPKQEPVLLLLCWPSEVCRVQGLSWQLLGWNCDHAGSWGHPHGNVPHRNCLFKACAPPRWKNDEQWTCSDDSAVLDEGHLSQAPGKWRAAMLLLLPVLGETAHQKWLKWCGIVINSASCLYNRGNYLFLLFLVRQKGVFWNARELFCSDFCPCCCNSNMKRFWLIGCILSPLAELVLVCQLVASVSRFPAKSLNWL